MWKVLVIALLVYSLLRFVMRLLRDVFFGGGMMGASGYRNPNKAQHRREDSSRPVGDVRVEPKSSSSSRGSGDFVDYEEVE